MGDDHQNIVFIGRFDPRNGLDTMIEAYRLLYRRARRRPCGSWSSATARCAASTSARSATSCATYVHFAGRLNRSRPNHLVSGDVFCTPCNRASFGMVLLEAMSCGRPVVASRISGFQLVMRDRVHGLHDRPGRLGRTVRRRARASCSTTRTTAIAMGAAGRREAVERYSWPRVGAQLETYYTDLIAGRQPTWANARH